jgi:hypothetical protein
MLADKAKLSLPYETTASELSSDGPSLALAIPFRPNERGSGRMRDAVMVEAVLL